jgi:integrase
MLDPVEIWISKMEKRHSGSPSTESRYRTQLQQFCDFIGTSPQQIVTDWKKVRQTGRLIDRDNYVEEMMDKIDAYENFLGKQDLTKASIFTYLVPVASFFKYLRIPVKVELGKRPVVYCNRDITVEEIRRILNNSNPRDRAFFLMMAQSGLRPITLTQLPYEALSEEFESDRIPCCVKVDQAITKGEYVSHFSFIAEDAVKALKDFFAERGAPAATEKIFGDLTSNAFSMRFGYAVRKLDLIDDEHMRKGRKPQPLRLYCLRKFFRKFAGPAGVDFVNFWMGHKLGVDEHYFSHDVEHHRKAYAEKAMPNLRILEPSALATERTIIELRNRIEELENKNRELKNRLNGYMLTSDQVKELLRRIEKLEKQAQKQT